MVEWSHDESNGILKLHNKLKWKRIQCLFNWMSKKVFLKEPMETFEVKFISKKEAWRIWDFKIKNMRVESFHFTTFGIKLFFETYAIKFWIIIWIQINVRVEKGHYAKWKMKKFISNAI